MKKVLSTVAALALVAGVASNALALDKPSRASEVPATTAPRVATPTAPGVALWSVAGQWVLAGAYVDGGKGNPGGADVQDQYSANDAFYIYSFKILPVLQVNDKISMKGEVRFADRCVFGTSCGSSASERDADFKHIYMEWISPIGKTRFGRTPAGAWGPKFMNSGSQGDRIMLWGNWMPDNWGMLLFTQKIQENDATIPGESDGDKDGYYVDISYKADMGKTIAALWVARDASATAVPGADSVTTTQFRLTGNYKFGDFGVEYEWNQNFGDGPAESGAGTTSKSDASGTGVMVDLNYTMDNWKFGLLGFYMSGDDDPTDNDTEAIFGQTNGTGKDYNPYQILTGDYMNLLNGDNPLSGGANDALFRQGSAGVMSFGAYVGWKMSPKLSFNGEIGMANATDEPDGYDDDYGVEFGVGMAYKIMDNLSYNAHFSFLSTGDYWEENGAYDTEDVWLAAHALSMKF
jgi:hypothetical protein